MQQAKPEPTAAKPKVDDYENWEDFNEALTDWKVDRKLEAIEQQKSQKEAVRSQQSESERINEKQTELLESGERKYDDFEDVVKSDNTVYSRAAYLSILESDQSADIVYYLAKNQDDAKRIAALPAYAQAKEIGKLEDKLSAKKPVKTSSAPKPIEPIGSGTASAKSPEEMSTAEYTEYRAKQGARWAR